MGFFSNTDPCLIMFVCMLYLCELEKRDHSTSNISISSLFPLALSNTLFFACFHKLSCNLYFGVNTKFDFYPFCTIQNFVRDKAMFHPNKLSHWKYVTAFDVPETEKFQKSSYLQLLSCPLIM